MPREQHAPELERRLLRRGVTEMAARRSACSRCRRALLVGERFGVFAPQGAECVVCELCLSEAPEGDLGEPLRLERVRASERVLRIRRAA